MTEIMPCPFCGGKPHIEKSEWYGEYQFCHTCKNQSPQLNIYSCGYSTKEEAIKSWNKRSD